MIGIWSVEVKGKLLCEVASRTPDNISGISQEIEWFLKEKRRVDPMDYWMFGLGQITISWDRNSFSSHIFWDRDEEKFRFIS